MKSKKKTPYLTSAELAEALEHSQRVGKNVVQLPIEFKPELKPADARDKRGIFD